ncbi:MAG: NAD(P)-dependent oxidoreductase [Gammaproteobacteria bacterium]|nr:NAD(P)-dependent oxidoreductase [Gammaproteobacteria bacterium]
MNFERVGFIGLGQMGRGMASNLARGGVPLSVYDARHEASAAILGSDVRVAPDLAQLAAEVQLLFLCLPYAPQVEAVLLEEGGILEHARPGLQIIDTTTLNRSAARRFAEQASARGVGYCDCPVSGMPFRAADGSLTIMFGGQCEVFEAVHPYLSLMGSTIVHCGEVGAGQLMKAINNIVYNVNIAALCEALPLAIKAGLPVAEVEKVLTSGSSKSFASDRFVSRILDRRFEDDFSLSSAYKDIVNVQEVATELAAATPVINAMIATYQQAIAQGHGDEPKSAMVKVYEQVLGLQARRDVKAGQDSTPD